MYEVHLYNGRRIRKEETSAILFQFDSEENMNRWLNKIYFHYGHHFVQYVNRKAYIVAL